MSTGLELQSLKYDLEDSKVADYVQNIKAEKDNLRRIVQRRQGGRITPSLDKSVKVVYWETIQSGDPLTLDASRKTAVNRQGPEPPDDSESLPSFREILHGMCAREKVVCDDIMPEGRYRGELPKMS